MVPLVKFDIVTIFPDFIQSPLGEGVVQQAIKSQLIEVNGINLREFTHDKHSTTDDRPFGGGEGMVMKAAPLAEAVTNIKTNSSSETKVILLSPQGQQLTQKKIIELSKVPELILICGRYEGVDERFIDEYVDEEISIGDFIISGGELGALIIVDAVTRVLPGVLGCPESVTKDTFSSGLLKHPQFTRPRCFEKHDVPDVLLSGDHKVIEEYRFISSIKQTIRKRPDLFQHKTFSISEIKLLRKYKLYEIIQELAERPN